MKKALIDETGRVAQVETQDFPIAAPCFWVDCPDDTVAGHTFYVNGQFVPETFPAPTADENKLKAQKRLQDSDFAVLPDVNLTNKSEWEAYRSDLRQIATNPTSGNLTWPVKPQTIWG